MGDNQSGYISNNSDTITFEYKNEHGELVTDPNLEVISFGYRADGSLKWLDVFDTSQNKVTRYNACVMEDIVYIHWGGQYVWTDINCHRLEVGGGEFEELVDTVEELDENALRKQNNLSDLSDLSESLGNLLNELETFAPVPGPSVVSQLSSYILCVGQISGPSQYRVTVPRKLTLDYLYNNYILPATNTEYGMTKNADTGRYGFTGTAASATRAENAYAIINGSPISSLGRRYFDCRRKTFSGLTGTSTVTFDPRVTTSTILNYNILSVSVIEVSTGGTAIVKGFSVSCESVPSDGDYEYTVSAEIEAQGSGIDVTLEILYSYEIELH